MEINEIITIKKDTTKEEEKYTVISKIGSGGQGTVWKIRNKDGKIFVAKVINEKNSQKKENKKANINKIINSQLFSKIEGNERKFGYKYVLPKGDFTDGNDFGYVMDYISGKSLDEMLMDGTIEKMNRKERLRLCQKLSHTIDGLHRVGYSYTDISWGNFLIGTDGTIYVIDCENIACSTDIKNGFCFLIGTGFFIAPEVAFGKEKVSQYSDRYALATLIFRILTNNVLPSAYHGKAMYSAEIACQNMLEVAEMESDDDIDINWRKFIFDQEDKSNNIEELCKECNGLENQAFQKKIKEVIKVWKNLSQELKALFYKAFSDPFDIGARPAASKWARELGKEVEGRQAIGTAQYSKIICSNGKVVEITSESFVVLGKELGLKQYEKIGQIKRDVSGELSFQSALNCWVYIVRNDVIVASLRRGESSPIRHGDKIKLGVSRSVLELRR